MNTPTIEPSPEPIVVKEHEYIWPSEVSLSGIGGQFLRFKWVYLGLVLLGAIGNYLYNSSQTPVWRAKASILLPIQMGTPSMLLSARQGPTQGTMVAGLLKSDRMATEVGKAIGMNKVDAGDKLQIEVLDTASQVTIAFADADRERAKKALNAAIETLETMQSESGFDMSTNLANNLESALRQRQRELEAAENAVTAFRQQLTIPITPTDPTASSLFAELNAKQMELGSLQQQLQALQANVKQAAEMATDASGDNIVLTNMRNRVAEKESQLVQARVTGGDQNPQIRRLEEELQALKDQLSRETERHVSAVSQGLDRRTQDMVTRRAMLQWQVERLQKMSDDAPKEVREYERLARNAQVLNQVVSELRVRYESEKVRAESTARNWTVVDHPYIERKPVNVRPLYSSALGALFGFIAAFGLTRIPLLRKR
jgi:uncharacterized protein involved in exopolysaccharide biosynthesis